MTHRRLALPAVLALFALIATGAAAAPLLAGWAAEDHTNIPPDPSAVHARLAGNGTSLGAAAGAAEAAVKGLASEVRLTGDSFEALVHTAAATFTVRVAADSGQVLETKEHPPYVFPGDPVQGEPTVLPSGLKYFEIAAGSGEMPAGPSTKVKVHYSGWLLNGTPFDSSVERGQPATFPLNGVISGWTEGVGSMKVGGKRKLVIPFDMAYGERGRPPTIPPRATLVFDVELLEIVP